MPSVGRQAGRQAVPCARSDELDEKSKTSRQTRRAIRETIDSSANKAKQK